MFALSMIQLDNKSFVAADATADYFSATMIPTDSFEDSQHPASVSSLFYSTFSTLFFVLAAA